MMNKYPLLLLVLTSMSTICMEESIYDVSSSVDQIKQKQREETKQWLLEQIRPLNAGRYFLPNDDARSNCVLLSEKCVKVLSGIETPTLVPALYTETDTITYHEAETKKLVSYESTRPEQVAFNASQGFVEFIALDGGHVKVEILEGLVERESLKFITSTLDRITQDIQELAKPAGDQKGLAGLIYYPYQGMVGGHYANFYRDERNNLFFVDAQDETVSQTPPTVIMGNQISNEVFFFPYYKEGISIKREKEAMEIKQEPDLMTYEYEQQEDFLAPTYREDKQPVERITIEQNNTYGNQANQKGKYLCLIKGCNKAYSVQRAMLMHLEFVHKVCRDPKCLNQKRAFSSLLGLQKHAYEAHKQELTYHLSCPQDDCSMQFSAQTERLSPAKLQEHLKRAHRLSVSLQEITDYHLSTLSSIIDDEPTVNVQFREADPSIPVVLQQVAPRLQHKAKVPAAAKVSTAAVQSFSNIFNLDAIMDTMEPPLKKSRKSKFDAPASQPYGYTCSSCGDMFPNQTEFQLHVAQKHS